MSSAFQLLHAQLGYTVEIKKPQPYDERTLTAEKTPSDKKIKAPKRFFQNLTTHYNYYYNAHNKLNEVIERAKAGFKDNFSELLPFYNYSLDATAAEQEQLDSVIYKARTGLVLHDLRNDWVDNMYMLWGAAYYFQKKFDSASLMFQFINYAFADKEKDGYYKYIGSRMDGNNALSISTKESNSLVKKAFSTSPSRNEAFIWQIRSLIELNDLTEAGSLISTLKNDPNFPERLHDDLEEVQAYWFYKQGVWDSSAIHLVNAFSIAETKQEKARWEFLAAQLFEKKGRLEEAQKLYAKSIGHGTDPVMDVYARLNLVRTNTTGGENYVDQNIAELVKMAKKEKYVDYRDIIYFMAAQMEIDRSNLAAAKEYLLKAVKYNNGNLASHSNAFLLIADLAYNQKKYFIAASFYDSIQTNELKEEEAKRVESRKTALSKIVTNEYVVERQDSLQHVASLPEEERKDLITKLVKQQRRQQGLGEDNALSSGTASSLNNNVATSTGADLFRDPSKGDWYFDNSSTKTKGAAQFKQFWGNRPNADNWRRFAQVTNQLQAKTPGNTAHTGTASTGTASSGTADPADNTPSYASLLKNVPLTPEAMRASDDSIKNALFNLGVGYLTELEDYPASIEAFEAIRSRFPDFSRMDEVLFQLNYAYTKTGDMAKAAAVKNLLVNKYASSRFATIAATGKDPAAQSKVSTQATKDYEAIYDMFIEGRFEEALAAKKIADSTYKTNYWEPQLLYIEAVYNIRQRNDSLAKNTLQTLVAQDPNAPLAKKAQNLLNVLSRRVQIEDELTRLQIERPKEDTVKVVQQPPPVIEQPATPLVKRDSAIAQPRNDVAVKPVPRTPLDTFSKKNIVVEKKTSNVYKFEPSLKHYAVVILDKVDPVFGSETKNAFSRFNRERYYNQPLSVNSVDLDSVHKLVLIGDFTNAEEALEYSQQAKRLAPTEIIPWLKQDKYSFSIVSPENLEVLQNLKDLGQYKKFLEQNLPGKF
jgi:hypothetical protein